MKIYFTVLILVTVVFWGSAILSQVEEDREDLWYKVTMTSGITLGLMVVGLGLYRIWFL